jgi:hypothetical protein
MSVYGRAYGTEWADDTGTFESEQHGENAFLINIFDLASKEFKFGVIDQALKPSPWWCFWCKDDVDQLAAEDPVTGETDATTWSVVDQHEIQSTVRRYQASVHLKLKMRDTFGEQPGKTDMASIVNWVTNKLNKIVPEKRIPRTMARYKEFIGEKIDSGELPPETADPRPFYLRPKVRQAGMVGLAGVAGLSALYWHKKKGAFDLMPVRSNPYGIIFLPALIAVGKGLAVAGAGVGGWYIGRKATGKKVLPDEGWAFQEEPLLGEDAFAQNDEAVMKTYNEFKDGYDNNVSVHDFGEATMRTSVWLPPTTEKIATRQAAVFTMLAARYVKAGGDNDTAELLYEDAEDFYTKADSASTKMIGEGGNAEEIGAPLGAAWNEIFMADPSVHTDLEGLLGNIQTHLDVNGIKAETKWQKNFRKALKDGEHGQCLAWPKYHGAKYVVFGGKKPSCYNDREKFALDAMKYGLWIVVGFSVLSYVRDMVPGGND